MKILKIGYTIIILLCVSCNTEKQPEDYYNTAYDSSSEGRHEEAISYLDTAIQLDSNFLLAYLERGTNKFHLGNYAGSIKDYEEIIKRDNDNIAALYNTALSLRHLNNNVDAIKKFNKIIQLKGGETLSVDIQYSEILNPDVKLIDVPTVEIKFERAMAYRDIDSLQKAFNDFSFCIKRDYLTGACLNEIGNLYFYSNNMIQACDYYKRSSETGDTDGVDNYEMFCLKKDTVANNI